ncbi:MAG: adenylate cyclase, class 2 [Patescibacteria group bacterium]|nr:adenylate cyclase, class 2 [Patescibacteria group bacterium]
MQTEIEAKWLSIDLNKVRARLRDIGAILIAPERLMTRRTYDYDNHRLCKVNGWIRVRDEGNKVTLSYKQLNDRTLHGTKEVCVEVDSFSKTCDFLNAIGMKSKSYQETRRESWKLGNAEIELDTWPWIPSFVEIEASDEGELKSVAEKLDFDYSKALHGSVELAYQAIYDVTEEEIDSWEEILFIDTPDWLLSRLLIV